MSDAEALVNTVNTVGVMGKGVALQFKEKFPENFKRYAVACQKKEVVVGKMFITPTNSMMNPKWIINFPTKNHWIHPSSYSYIEAGIDDLIMQIEKFQIKSIAIPPLGSGQGGLDWHKVKQIIVEKMHSLSIDIIIYEPILKVKKKQNLTKEKLTKPRAMILALISQYKKSGYEVSLLEIQKLAYFLQRMGQTELKLNYKQYLYGPYAHNLQHLLHEMEKGYILSEKSILDSKPLDLIELDFSSKNDVSQFMNTQFSLVEKQRLEQLFKLLTGFESPFGLELLSTVDWIMHHHNTSLTPEVIKENIKNWSQRKDDNFDLNHVISARNRLQMFSNELGYC